MLDAGFCARWNNVLLCESMEFSINASLKNKVWVNSRHIWVSSLQDESHIWWYEIRYRRHRHKYSLPKKGCCFQTIFKHFFDTFFQYFFQLKLSKTKVYYTCAYFNTLFDGVVSKNNFWHIFQHSFQHFFWHCFHHSFQHCFWYFFQYLFRQ